MCKAYTSRKSGFSLIEAAIVLGIVGVVIGGIWVAASAVAENRRLSRSIEQITQITQTARAKIKPNLRAGDYVFFWNGAVIPGYQLIRRANWTTYLPADMVGSHDAPVNPYGNPTEMIVTANEIGFNINLGTNVKACAKLGPRIAAAARSEKDPYGGNVTVVTIHGYFDVSSPADSPSLCQTELENMGEIVIGFNIRL